MNVISRCFLPLALCCSANLWGWSNPTLVSHEFIQSMPQVATHNPVKVESLAEFLMANEEAVAMLL